MTSRRGVLAAGLVAALVVGVVVLITADDDDADGGEAGAPAASGTAALPPTDLAALHDELDPVFEPLGLRLTRGGLQRAAGDTAGGPRRHLALYVEPITGEYAPAAYLGSLVTSTQAVLPLVFDRWPGLLSMDICQEPRPGVDDRDAPPPVTTVTVLHKHSDAIAWEALDLPALLIADDERLVDVYVQPAIEAEPEYAAARQTADARATQKPGTQR